MQVFGHPRFFSIVSSAVLSLSLLSPTIFAYGPCDSDAQKLCNDSLHQETERSCLHKKIEQLSAECKSFVQSRDAEWKKMLASWELVKSACSKDLSEHCGDIKIKADDPVKAMQVCLMMQSEKISKPCKTEINRHIKEYQPNIKELE